MPSPSNQLTSELMGGIIRYIIAMLLIMISFLNIFNVNLQFTMSITLLIVLVFSTTIIIRDVLATTSILTEANMITRLTSTSVFFRNTFLIVLCIGVIFKIISLTLFIVVFNYGRSQISENNANNISLTKDNSITFHIYIALFITSTIAIGFLTLMVFMLYTSYETRVTIINISSIVLSLLILGLSSYEMVYASTFFNIFKYKGIVYQSTK